MNMNINDELKEHASNLYELRQKDGGMRIPDSYFKDFEDRVFTRIDQEGARREIPRQSLFIKVFRNRYVLSVAASLALLIAALWYFRQSRNLEVSYANSIELLPEDATYYVLENTQEFDIEQLASIDEDEIKNSALPEQNPSSVLPSTETPLIESAEEEIEQILKDMSEEELESLING